ncbi:MAG: SDR family NAD(P)-dependent oxidoreductase [Rubrivivax sp.]
MNPPPRRVLVTGAASGIGLAIARAFADQGHALMLADRDARVHDRARELAAQGHRAVAHVADLADLDQAVALARAAQATLGGCDVLVNNAGISPKRDGLPPSPLDVGVDEWEHTLRVNLSAPFVLCRELLPGMIERRFGRIVNIASRAGRTFVGPAATHYAASKAGLIGMTRHLAGLYAAQGITVNAIAPGRIETPLSSTSSAAVLEAAVAAIPARRLGRPDEIAAAALYLASDAAGYVTGTCLDVNGGVFMS